MRMLRIGEVAKQVGVSVQTIRFYERRGLLPKPSRRPSGYREYPEDVVRRLRFIRRAKGLGFSLEEIRDLLALRVAPDGNCGRVRRKALEKAAMLEARIAELERMRRALLSLAESCPGRGSAGNCPILQALDEQEEEYA